MRRRRNSCFTPTAEGQYRCLVKEVDRSGNIIDSTYTGYVIIKLNSAIPVITSYPQNVTDKCVGSSVIFNVIATDARQYKWYRQAEGSSTWTAVTDYQLSPEYSLTAAAEDDNYKYGCLVTNGCG